MWLEYTEAVAKLNSLNRVYSKVKKYEKKLSDSDKAYLAKLRNTIRFIKIILNSINTDKYSNYKEFYKPALLEIETCYKSIQPRL